MALIEPLVGDVGGDGVSSSNRTVQAIVLSHHSGTMDSHRDRETCKEIQLLSKCGWVVNHICRSLTPVGGNRLRGR